MSERPPVGPGAEPALAERPFTVLVVDDTEGNRYAMVRLLRRAGLEVREAETAAEAFAALGRLVPDLVVLDINLADASLLDVLRAIRAEPATAAVPVMHVSASFVSNVDRAVGLEGGADAYLTHPLDPDVFLATSRALLRADGERARLYHAEHVARRAAEGAAARATLLQDLTASLARSMSAAEVGQVVLTRALEALGALAGMLGVVAPGGEEMLLLGNANMPSTIDQRWARYPLSTNSPTAEATRTGRVVSLATRAAMRARYPEREHDVFARLSPAPNSLHAVPLIVDRGPAQRVLGGAVFLWEAEGAVGAPEAALIAAVADQCALALERARLYDAERAARAEAQAAETRLRELFDQAPVAVAVLAGPEHRYTLASPLYTAFAHGRPLLGRTIREAFPELEGQGWFEVMDRVYATGEPFAAAERPVRLDRPGGGAADERFFSISYQPLRDAAGRVYAIASVAVDVTEQLRARAEVERARDEAHAARLEAEQANAVKAEFLTTMSHELRTPLNAIGGYVELITMGLRGPVTEAQLRDMERIKRAQQHLLGLINSVLNYAKLEAGRVQYDLADVALGPAARAVEGLVLPQARAKGLVLDVAECPPDLAARADAEKLRQVLLNLLSNAVKFTDPGGRVTIACDAPSSTTVALRVRDTGRGIPTDQLARVFEPFVQVGRRLATTDEGTGLGLAISRDLARAMGGDLTAESTPGVGSAFTLLLPRAR